MTTNRNNDPASVDEVVALRALSARSAIASTLLGTRPPSLPGRQLVRSCEILGIAGGTARVAMTRMVATGELEAVDGRYTLIGPLRERQHRQDESLRGISHLSEAAADRTWSMFVLHSSGSRTAGQRSALRSSLLRYRYGEVREGVWARPANLGDQVAALAVISPHATHWNSVPGDARALVNDLWDLDAWSIEAARLRRAMRHGQRDLDAADAASLPGNFALDAAVIRHLQADPLLPFPLLPRNWPGRELRAEHTLFDAAFNRVWRSALKG